MTEHKDVKAPEGLLAAARAASERAYAPYSGARVGAAVPGEEGAIHAGCNVENASYGLTQCAERAALNAAIAAGVAPGRTKQLVIYASGFERLSPCGACRQVMSELLHPEATVYCCNESGEIRHWHLAELFPEPFVLE